MEDLGSNRAQTAEAVLRGKLRPFVPEENTGALVCLQTALAYEKQGRRAWAERYRETSIEEAEQTFRDMIREKRTVLENRGAVVDSAVERELSKNTIDWMSATLCQKYLGVAFLNYRYAFAQEIVSEGAVRKELMIRAFGAERYGDETCVAYLENEQALGLHSTQVLGLHIKETRGEIENLDKRLCLLKRAERAEEITSLAFDEKVAIPQELLDLRVEELGDARRAA